ncbi:hypothetical protein [Amycolatopsis vastitatis]|uniref:Uncharacterized protein n=1 Tax=Amycolatopsis vastitatis TaxID=1905142 RepID=A0A229SLL9_9PSEU|nr:hypothetical protein [Amycolatopsis vastitatis]OXM59644.1 hypothetical protein CF165_46465 [Amycolatopsis vastitatis]
MLTQTLPELVQSQRRFSAHREIQACTRCSRRHRGGTVLIHPARHQHVCVRHNIWLGTLGPDSSSWIQHPGPVDVSALPEIQASVPAPPASPTTIQWPSPSAIPRSS